MINVFVQNLKLGFLYLEFIRTGVYLLYLLNGHGIIGR